jgi:hypothetical protein
VSAYPFLLACRERLCDAGGPPNKHDDSVRFTDRKGDYATYVLRNELRC